MCGRYFLADSGNSGELRGIIDQLNRRGATVKTGEIFPTDTVPVLANNRNRRVMPFSMQWGYTLSSNELFRVGKARQGENQVRHPTGGCRLAIHGGAVPRGERARSVHHSNA